MMSMSTLQILLYKLVTYHNNQHYFFEYSSSLSNIDKTLSHEELLSNKCPIPEQGYFSALSSLYAHCVAAAEDNDLLHHGVTVYDIHSVAHIYAKMNNKQKNVLLIGNKYLPNIQYRMIKTNLSLINRDYNVDIVKFY